MKPQITELDYNRAAAKLGCAVSAIKAVAHVESLGRGFLPTDEPVILFEAHVFSRMTNHRFDRTHPNISSRKWNKRLYGPAGANQHKRLQAAVALDRDAALQSASWGKFQVMGFNWDELGYPSLRAFINAMYSGEPAHLDSCVRYIIAFGLAGHLRKKNWAAFANGYNGERWAENDYANKLARADRMYS